MKQLYLDLDGVFADFDAAVRVTTGKFPWDLDEDAMWAALVKVPFFYRTLPLMPGAAWLYGALRRCAPVFLSGCPDPTGEMAFAPQDKAQWLAARLDPDARLITCRSRDKATFCTPGDVLLDDRDRYADLWRAAGGVFLHHDPAEIGRSVAAVHGALA